MAQPLLSAAEAGYLLAVVALLAFSVTVLCWMLYAWSTPEAADATGFPAQPAEPVHSFSLLVPARHEEAVLPETLRALARLEHPAYEVIVIVGHDDPGTAAVAQEWAARHPDIGRVVVDTNWPKNKPKALNTALPQCAGDIVAVFDAEDEVHPQLLRHVDTCFAVTGVDMVQAGVQPMNHRSSWWALLSSLEYYVYYRSLFHQRARQRFIPLGGNTVFVRTSLVQATNGWDANCLAEDCELGVRLSSLGARAVAAYDPDLVTREETPADVRGLFHQRVRWQQGFFQVLRKGDWRRLPTRRQRMVARCALAMPMVQAASWLVVPIAMMVMFVLRLPVAVALFTFLLFIPLAARLVLDLIAYGELCSHYGFRRRVWDYVGVFVGTPLFQSILAVAGAWAVTRELRGERGWYKTEHAGAHREAGVGIGTR
ncbi:MAG: glycosyltransferase family 2 protein [Acidimicrobiia bacterium]|nr:glycosyltransferase family 2 protein [Acidimicrobiia bacterium]